MCGGVILKLAVKAAKFIAVVETKTEITKRRKGTRPVIVGPPGWGRVRAKAKQGKKDWKDRSSHERSSCEQERTIDPPQSPPAHTQRMHPPFSLPFPTYLSVRVVPSYFIHRSSSALPPSLYGHLLLPPLPSFSLPFKRKSLVGRRRKLTMASRAFNIPTEFFNTVYMSSAMLACVNAPDGN